MSKLHKYPRTEHIQGSRLQPGDENLNVIPVQELKNCLVIIEEKLDGANSAISFGADGELLLQSRGHYLTGGYRERHFARFKSWAARHQTQLWEHLGSRYIMYGEWLYACHTIYYDQLPSYFMEFDVFDRDSSTFLSTKQRRKLLANLPVQSVPVLSEGSIETVDQLQALLGPSLYKSTSWKNKLKNEITRADLQAKYVLQQIENSDFMEGLYIKCETEKEVTNRYKFVRCDFLTQVVHSGSHWLDRPILPNRLAPGVTFDE